MSGYWLADAAKKQLFMSYALLLGLLWFLLGMQVLSSSKIYHQGLILFLWLPGLLALIFVPDVRKSWNRPLFFLLILVIAWAGLSISWGGEGKRAKVFLYVFLSANAFVAFATINVRMLWRGVALGAFISGMVAWVAIAKFYIVGENSFEERVVAMGHLNHTIMASHVMGALGVLLVTLREFLPRPIRRWAWVLSSVGLLAFLVLSKSKGPLIAALCALIFYVVCAPSRRRIIFLLMVLFGATLSVWLFPEYVLRGGFSYRPDLLLAGYKQFLFSPWLGMGVGADYILSVADGRYSLEHAHNIYLHILIQLGVVGLLLWCVLQGYVLMQAYLNRASVLGRMLCALFCFGAVALLTDGIGPWIKPREEWFTTWLPLFFCLAMLASKDKYLSVPE